MYGEKDQVSHVKVYKLLEYVYQACTKDIWSSLDIPLSSLTKIFLFPCLLAYMQALLFVSS